MAYPHYNTFIWKKQYLFVVLTHFILYFMTVLRKTGFWLFQAAIFLFFVCFVMRFRLRILNIPHIIHDVNWIFCIL